MSTHSFNPLEIAVFRTRILGSYPRRETLDLSLHQKIRPFSRT